MSELASCCPECEDAAVYQLNFEGEVYWVARGWHDPHTNTDTAISYCPLCGVDLEELGTGGEADGEPS